MFHALQCPLLSRSNHLTFSFQHILTSLNTLHFPLSTSQEDFDEEVEEYERQLERQFVLCSRCAHMTERVIARKDWAIQSTWVQDKLHSAYVNFNVRNPQQRYSIYFLI